MNTYSIEISIMLQSENQETAWDQIYKLVHDLLESEYLAKRIKGWEVGEPELIEEDAWD